MFLCSRARYVGLSLALPSNLHFVYLVFLCLTVCYHTVGISPGEKIRTDTGCTNVVG